MSEQQKMSWDKFENTILYYRSNVCSVYLIFSSIYFTILGKQHF